MAKNNTPVTDSEVDQTVDQVVDQTTDQLDETPVEVAVEQSTVTINVPNPEPVQAGYGSRDFGRAPKDYEAALEQPVNSTPDGGEEEPEV